MHVVKVLYQARHYERQAAGPIQPGKPHYYRVQGPTFILEYDNVQNKANHVHAVWRDFKNDFGEDLLRKHYDTVPHETK